MGQDSGAPYFGQECEASLDCADSQVEFNVGPAARGGAMDDAVDAALARAAPDLSPPSSEMIAAARARATDMLREMPSENGEGLKDLQNLTLSMGLPATRATFQFMIKAANLRGEAKKNALSAVADFSPLTEVGCMKVDFFNQTLGAPDVAYLILDKCPRLHNLGAQIDKLKAHVSDEKWPEVIRSLSMLVHIGRSVYGQTARKHLDLIRQIHGSAADDPCTKFLDLQIDRENTTLFLDPSWPSRIGIFIRLSTDVQASLAH
jgi:hypothetical protein